MTRDQQSVDIRINSRNNVENLVHGAGIEVGIGNHPAAPVPGFDAASTVVLARTAVEVTIKSGVAPESEMNRPIRRAAFKPRGASGRSWSREVSLPQSDLAWRITSRVFIVLSISERLLDHPTVIETRAVK